MSNMFASLLAGFNNPVWNKSLIFTKVGFKILQAWVKCAILLLLQVSTTLSVITDLIPFSTIIVLNCLIYHAVILFSHQQFDTYSQSRSHNNVLKNSGLIVKDHSCEWTALPSQYLWIFSLSLTNTVSETNPNSNLMMIPAGLSTCELSDYL